MSDLYAPAFMNTAPPTVPGIPVANSKPVKPRLEHLYANWIKLKPAPTFITVSFIDKLLNSFKLIIIPS